MYMYTYVSFGARIHVATLDITVAIALQIPWHPSIVEPNFPIKLDPQPGPHVVFVLHPHDDTMGVLKQVLSSHRNLNEAGKVFLEGEGGREGWKEWKGIVYFIKKGTLLSVCT